MSEELWVMYPAPIPVGHRVEIRWYELSEENVWGRRKSWAQAHEPLIRDLDTGVEYCSDFILGSDGSKAPRVPLAVGAEPPANAQPTHVLVGKVVACRVVSVRGFADFDVQTRLRIEPEG